MITDSEVIFLREGT